MVDRPDPVAPGIPAGRAIIEHGVVGPAVPQGFDHGDEFVGSGIAVGVADRAVVAVVAGGRGQPGSDDVPADPAIADVIQRGELPCEVEWLGVRGRGRCDQADPAGCAGQRAECGDRFEPVAGGRFDHLAQRQRVGQEDRVEQAGLGPLRELTVVGDVGQRQRRTARVAPGRFVVTPAVDEQVQVHRAGHRASPRCRFTAAQAARSAS